MNWTHHTPKHDGDAPDGVTLETHFIQWQTNDGTWMDCTARDARDWEECFTHRYLPRNPPATYAQVCAWHEYHGLPVPPRPVDYEAWRDTLLEGRKAFGLHYIDDENAPLTPLDKNVIDGLLAAMRVAINSPACMEALNNGLR